MTALATIHIVDDDASFRTSVGDLLTASGYRVSLYESAQEFLKNPTTDEPACVLLDVQMAGLSGPQLQNHLAEVGRKLPIVFITGYGDIPTSVQTIKAGAEDFLTKPAPKEKLLEAINRALARHKKLQEESGRVAALRSLLDRLTPRERDVFMLLIRGKPHKQIAFELGTSERTVKLHRHNIVEKFEVRSLAELAVIAERLGLLPASRSDDETDPARGS
jgi:FixJ family two-component response regulator